MHVLPKKGRGCCILCEEVVMCDVAPESGYHIDASLEVTMLTELTEGRLLPLGPRGNSSQLCTGGNRVMFNLL